MKENEKALEEIFTAFYDVVDAVEQNLPELTGDEDVDELVQEQLDQYNQAIAQFQKAYKKLKTEPEMRHTSEELLKFYEDHPQEFADDLEGLDNVIGFLGNDRRHPMDELGADHLLKGKSPTEILIMAFYSHDTDDGGPFNPGRKYFRHDGGLFSTNDRDYRPKYLNANTVAVIVNNAPRLHLSKGAQRIIDESEEKR